MEDHLKYVKITEIAEQISILNLIMKQYTFIYIGLWNRTKLV